MVKSNAAAIILARGGSKGIPRKNLKRVGGVSLLARSIAAAKGTVRVSSVWVSTDDADIAREAQRHDAQVVRRPPALACDQSTSEASWLHALHDMRDQGCDPSYLVLLQCTSPFTTGQDIDACFERLDQGGLKSTLSVIEDHSFLWRADADGVAQGVNHNAAQQRKRRQDLEPCYKESGALYVVNASAFAQQKSRFIEPVALVPVAHPPIEIDTPEDLKLARIYADQTTSQAPSRLDHIKALVMDFDGVHTDDLVHTTQDGEETVVTSRRDGMGLAQLRKSGKFEMLIVSKERNPVVLARASKLKIDAMHAVDDKVSALQGWLDAHGLDWHETAFIGNDINDVAVLDRSGLSICPSDAHESVMSSVDWVIPAPGGRGALRHLCDSLIAAHR